VFTEWSRSEQESKTNIVIIIKNYPLSWAINMEKKWPLWEIFVRSKNGLEHRHFGSLHAADADMALENARDVYTRRSEGVSIWVVESKNITASSPENNAELFEPAHDKVYRHPTFYTVPDEIKHM
jgi:ring-1,2-phenylacetyl-CoA epoxidase subunit PaaB